MKISVIVTSYNYEQYIRKTLDSLVNQTYKNFEVIIIDDGSKDKSVEIIKEYVKKYSNFYLYTHEGNVNKGLIKSLKLGISKASGNYIAFLESDDFWSVDHLQEKVNYIKEHPNAKIVINDIQTIENKNNDCYVEGIRMYYISQKNKRRINFDFFCNTNGIATFSTVLIDKYILENLNFNSPIPAWLDWWLWRQVAIQYPIHFIDKELTFWRIHNESYISVDKDENNKKLKFFKKESKKILSKNYKLSYYVYKLPKLFKEITQGIFSIKNSSDRKYKILKIFGIKIFLKKGSYKLNPKKYQHSCLIISHELSYTGAPVILIPLIELLKRQGKNVVVLSMNKGPLLLDLKKMKIETLLLSDIYNQQEEFMNFAKQFDLVFCNTIITSPLVFLLNKINKKFIWWVHESFTTIEHIINTPTINGIIPPLELLKKVDSVYTESEYASEMFLSNYVSNVKILPYGIKDNSHLYRKNNSHSKVVFTMIATFNERKAQDVLIEAIKLLPEQYYDQIQIDFVGAIDNRFARHLKNIASDFSFVKFKGRIKFDDKNELYRNTDVLICISRDDPFPVVVSEAMSLSIPCIVSCNVGQSKLIQDNFNSFIVSTGNAEELKNKIIYCINNRSNLNKIGKNAREIYLNNASLENFEKEIGKIL